MTRIALVAAISLALAACGDSKAPAGKTDTATAPTKPAAAAPAKPAAAGDKLALKADGRDLSMDVKSGVMNVAAQETSEPKYNHAKYQFVLANHDLMANSSLLMKDLTNADEIRVVFRLLGPAASGKDTPLAPGTYSTEGAWPKFDNDQYVIVSVVDGKPKFDLSQNFPANATKGAVKIVSVEGDTVKGEIDVTTADKLAIKGSFTAKIKPMSY